MLDPSFVLAWADLSCAHSQNYWVVIDPTPAPLAFPPGSGVRFTIGRTRDCDLCLTDLSVSRMHALLVRREDGWVLSDLGSHNGTRLNGWLVREPVQVRAGDRVEFGSMAFIIQGEHPVEGPPVIDNNPGECGDLTE